LRAQVYVALSVNHAREPLDLLDDPLNIDNPRDVHSTMTYKDAYTHYITTSQFALRGSLGKKKVLGWEDERPL
jgi:hypothetical protein